MKSRGASTEGFYKKYVGRHKELLTNCGTTKLKGIRK